MRYLLDTCVLSEWKKATPDPNVLKWLKYLNFSDLFISILTIGELRKGILSLPTSKKQSDLNTWLSELEKMFENKIINLSSNEIHTWSTLINQCEKSGKPVPAIDSLIAATAITHHLTIATRNVKDMESTGSTIYNPWQNKWINSK